MAGAKHPLVAAHRSHAAAHLARERLKAESAIGGRQSARNGIVGSLGLLSGEKYFDGLVEAAVQQGDVAWKRDDGTRSIAPVAREVKAVNRVEKKEGAHASIEVLRTAAKRVELLAFHQQLIERGRATDGVERGVANSRIVGVDDIEQPAHCASPEDGAISLSTRSSTMRESTSLRSRPASASASWAMSTP